jgi:hypothetical protein
VKEVLKVLKDLQDKEGLLALQDPLELREIKVLKDLLEILLQFHLIYE